ncbi:unnamed protein product, partial [Prunus brigantina]
MPYFQPVDDPFEVRSKDQRAAQDWFHTLPFASISNAKVFALIFTKEYTSYKTIRTPRLTGPNPNSTLEFGCHTDHLFNLHKKPDESLQDYLKRFKAEKANIIGCNDRIASSTFKKGLPAKQELYREPTITQS